MRRRAGRSDVNDARSPRSSRWGCRLHVSSSSLFFDTVVVRPTASVSSVAIRVAVAVLLAPRLHAVAVRHARRARVLTIAVGVAPAVALARRLRLLARLPGRAVPCRETLGARGPAVGIVVAQVVAPG